MFSKVITIGFLLIVMALSLNAQSSDKVVINLGYKTDSLSAKGGNIWWAQDKGRHLVGSLISTVFIGKFSQEMLDKNIGDSKMWGAGITFSLGLAKEILDSQKKGNRFSVEDLIADIAGITIGILILGVH